MLQSRRPKHWPKASYDPRYDPIVDTGPGHNREKVYYAMGYGGNGVMYSVQAGRRLAQLVAGRKIEVDLPIFTSQLPSHGILTPFRRLGQRVMYVWYHLQDEVF
jgi:glycine/D-amino acid oxidase-like deaminating enzyme